MRKTPTYKRTRTGSYTPTFTAPAKASARAYANRRSVANYSANLPEKKFFDTTLGFNIDTTGEVPATGQLALIPQGDTESTRDGRKAVIESIQIRAKLLYSPGAAATASVLACMWLVLDTQCNGAAAAWDDVFAGTGLDAMQVMLNLNNSGRFRILKHWTYKFNPAAGVTTAFNTDIKPLEWFKKCNIPMDWSNTDGALTGIRSNNIFLLAGSVGGDDLVSVAGTCRLRFRG